MIVILFLGLSIQQIIHPNRCANYLGRQPTSPQECLADTSNPNSTCCFTELTMLDITETFCYPISKNSSSKNDEIGPFFDFMGANLKSFVCDASEIINHSIKKVTNLSSEINKFENLCSLSLNRQPDNVAECLQDKSIRDLSCCYISGKDSSGNSVAFCDPKPTESLQFDMTSLMKDAWARSGLKVEKYFCEVDASYLSISIAILFILFYLLI